MHPRCPLAAHPGTAPAEGGEARLRSRRGGTTAAGGVWATDEECGQERHRPDAVVREPHASGGRQPDRHRTERVGFNPTDRPLFRMLNGLRLNKWQDVYRARGDVSPSRCSQISASAVLSEPLKRIGRAN